MRGIKWDLLPRFQGDAHGSRGLGRGWNLGLWEVFVYFFSLPLGESSCLLVPREWRQHRGALLLQGQLFVLGICDRAG